MIFREKRADFEENLQRKDVAEFFLQKSKDEIDEKYGSFVSKMVGFDQKNVHHCYDLWEHTIRAIEGIKSESLTKEQFIKLRIAAFFHDIGKPDKAKINDKTGQQVFYGHALESAEVAKPILEEIGYSAKEIEQILFLIGHHDDFISYSISLPPNRQNHIFMREITPETIAEKIIENKYDFKKIRQENSDKPKYNDTQIRYICYVLAHGKEPDFRENNRHVKVSVDMDEVRRMINSGELNSEYIPSLEDYKLLLVLCKADAGAQALDPELNGRKLGSRKEKVGRMEAIEENIEEAFLIVQKLEQGKISLKNIEKTIQNKGVSHQNP